MTAVYDVMKGRVTCLSLMSLDGLYFLFIDE